MVTLKNDDVVEGRGDGAAAGSGPARELVDGLVSSGALDSLFERIDKGDVELTGDGGLIPELVRAALERGLEAEMTSHLGYASSDREGKTASGSTNSRNGSYPKTLATEVGPVTIQAPRDREGSFTPRLVPKCSRRLGGLDDMIISLYAGGMTVRDIGHHLAKTGRHRVVARDGLVGHRRGGGRGARVAGAAVGRVLPGHVPGRDTRQGQGRRQGRVEGRVLRDRVAGHAHLFRDASP